MVKTSTGTFLKGAIALPGMAKPEEKNHKTPANSKAERVVSEKLAKAPQSTIETSSVFKNLKIINEKGAKDTVYFKKSKNIFWIEKKNNGFVEFLKALFFVNFFRCTLLGYSSNSENVYKGFDKIIKDLNSLKNEASVSQETQKLMETLNKTNTIFEEARVQYLQKGKVKDAGAIQNLQRRIADIVQSDPASPVKKSPEGIQASSAPFFAPAPSPVSIVNPAPMNVSPASPLPASIVNPAPMNVSPASPLPASIVNPAPMNVSPASPVSFQGIVQGEKEEAKPKLPALEIYEIPEVEIKSALDPLQTVKTKIQKRSASLSYLNDYYKEFIEARNKLISKNEKLETIAVQLQPQNPQVRVGNGPGAPLSAPPSPPHSMPPSLFAPPPPKNGPPMPNGLKQPTFRDKQKALLQNVKLDPHVSLLTEINNLEAERDLAIKEIKAILFPGIKGLSFTSEEEIATLEQYIEAYQNQATAELEALEQEVERLAPRKRPIGDSSSNQVNGSAPVDRPLVSAKVASLNQLLEEIAKHQKAIADYKQKIESYDLDRLQAIDGQNKLAKEIILKRTAGSYKKDERQKETVELENLENKARQKEKDIELAKQNIATLMKKIESAKKQLAVEVKINMNSSLDDVIVKAKEIIAEESQS